jgi:hypothetical protein
MGIGDENDRARAGVRRQDIQHQRLADVNTMEQVAE